VGSGWRYVAVRAGYARTAASFTSVPQPGPVGRRRCLARVLADEDRREAVDERRETRATERLVVLAPADETVVRRDLDENEGAPAGVGVSVSSVAIAFSSS
jgi:hypothetical protein